MNREHRKDDWNIETALNHHPGCSVAEDGVCICLLLARREQIERSPLAPGEGTWSVFAQKVVAERDAAREEVERLRKDHERSTDWYQQRFNRLRQWVKEEVEPLSEDVARRYFAICANGSPSPHESADWRETMHGLSLERDSLRAENERLRRASFVEAAENDRLRGQIDSLIEAADAARLLLLFAAGPHEAGAVPAMLAAAIERAKGAK